MGARGPKSSASLTVVPLTGRKKPPPPAQLTGEEAAIWRQVIDAMPTDWHRPESTALLVQFCRHIVVANHIADQIARCLLEPSVKAASMDLLLKMQQRESAAIASLATKMRLTQQSRYTAKSAATAREQADVSHLWEGDPASEFLD